VTFLKKGFPGTKVAASKGVAEIGIRPGAIKPIAELNQTGRDTVRKWYPDLASEEAFQPFTFDQILSDGDRIELEDDLHKR
jgi:hypothetical protein